MHRALLFLVGALASCGHAYFVPFSFNQVSFWSSNRPRAAHAWG